MTQFTNLSNISSQLQSFGKEYLGQDAPGSFIKGTKGLFDRFILWFRGDSSPIVANNTQAINSISNSIQETLGEEYSASFLSFIDNVRSGSRPVRSEQIAVAINQTLHLRNETTGRFFSLVNDALPNVIDAAVERYMLNPEVKPSLRLAIEDYVTRNLQSIEAIQTPLSVDAAVERLEEIANDLASEMPRTVSDENQEQIKTDLQSSLAEHGVELATPMVKNLSEEVVKLMTSREFETAVEPTNLAELQNAAIERVVGRFNNQLQTVQESTLSDEHKTALTNTFFANGKLVSEPHLALILESFESTVSFFKVLFPHRNLMTEISVKDDAKEFCDSLHAKLSRLDTPDLAPDLAATQTQAFYAVLFGAALQAHQNPSVAFFDNYTRLLLNTMYDIQCTHPITVIDLDVTAQVLKQVFTAVGTTFPPTVFTDDSFLSTIDINNIQPGMLLLPHLFAIAVNNGASSTLPPFLEGDAKQQILANLRSEIQSTFLPSTDQAITKRYYAAESAMQEGDIVSSRYYAVGYRNSVALRQTLNDLAQELPEYERIRQAVAQHLNDLKALQPDSAEHRDKEIIILELNARLREIGQTEPGRRFASALQQLEQAQSLMHLHQAANARAQAFERASSEFDKRFETELKIIRSNFSEDFLKDFDRSFGIMLNGNVLMPARDADTAEAKMAVFEDIIESFDGDKVLAGKVLSPIHQGLPAIIMNSLLTLPDGMRYMGLQEKTLSTSTSVEITGPEGGDYVVVVNFSSQKPSGYVVSSLLFNMGNLELETPTLTVRDAQVIFEVAT